MLGSDRCGRHLLVEVAVDEAQAGLGEDLEAEVAPLLDPLVVLLGQDGADEPDDGEAVGEDPDDVGASADLPVEPFLRVVGPDLGPALAGEAGERRVAARGRR
jgi:hypothetical protein